MPAAASPLTAAYDRLGAVFPGLTVTELGPDDPAPRGAGWVGAAGLAAGGAELDAFLAWDGAQVVRDYGRPARPDVVASFGLHRYAWPACLLITVPWFLHRRVPRLPVTHVSYDRTAGRMAVRRPVSVACLPGDPAAALPGAVVVPDEEALRAEVRAAAAEHLEPVLAAFGPRMRRRGRALWGMATDELVEGLWYVAGLLGEREAERAVRELALLLPGATLPYAGSAGFRVLTGPDGTPLPTRDRASCCMFYTVRPKDTCATCPRTCDDARIAKLASAAAA
ncbi:(2Fe-2S)-binding protein [Streptomyces sp. 5-8]|uniref:(2Fe-2S)-binding protein n=1 Tax=Streptomyces musisoli TaxID=2802280 RepID=A0ABS1NV17_9ACTN|nr:MULTISPECIES: (2Fe-2S)-binding protein [Streptomyces]MBL1103586.1 (2Fe-2S)-binding protein [Streptomyces musisoli]MBY8839808.1 (2Fe-2S)-binding protein [Streptomyces sp. SP2-10]